jgi:hypothetical protein
MIASSSVSGDFWCCTGLAIVCLVTASAFRARQQYGECRPSDLQFAWHILTLSSVLCFTSLPLK